MARVHYVIANKINYKQVRDVSVSRGCDVNSIRLLVVAEIDFLARWPKRESV